MDQRRLGGALLSCLAIVVLVGCRCAQLVGGSGGEPSYQITIDRITEDPDGLTLGASIMPHSGGSGLKLSQHGVSGTLLKTLVLQDDAGTNLAIQYDEDIIVDPAPPQHDLVALNDGVNLVVSLGRSSRVIYPTIGRERQPDSGAILHYHIDAWVWLSDEGGMAWHRSAKVHRLVGSGQVTYVRAPG